MYTSAEGIPWHQCCIDGCGGPAAAVYRPAPKNTSHPPYSMFGYCQAHIDENSLDKSLNTEYWSVAPIVREPHIEQRSGQKLFYVAQVSSSHFTHKCFTGNTKRDDELYSYLPGGSKEKALSGTLSIAAYYFDTTPPPSAIMTNTSWMAEAVNTRNQRISLLKTLVAIADTKPRVDTLTASASEQPLSAADAAESTTMTQTVQPIVEARLVAVGGPSQHSVASFLVPGQAAPQALRVMLSDGEFNVGDTINLQLEVDQRYKVIKAGKPGSIGNITGLNSHVGSASEVHPGALSGSKTITTSGSGIVGLRKVKVPANFYVTEALKTYFNALQKLSAHGKPVRGRLIGPTGVGKTTGVYYFAGLTDRPFLKVNMSTISAPEELFGIRTLEDGKTGFQETAFVRALQTPNACIFLEEINRTHSSNVNPLMEVLDGFGETWVDAVQQLITVDPSVTIFAAMNVGASYTGTFDMDAALESRFEYPIELSYLPEAEEAKVLVLKTGVDPRIAAGMVELANDTRRMAQSESTDALDKAISTRTLLAACDLIAIGGMNPSEALHATVLPLYSIEGGDGSQRAKVAKITQGKFSGGRR